MKVKIDRERDGWYFTTADYMRSELYPTYPEVVRRAVQAGHEIDNAGWKHRLLMWNWNNHAIDGYPEWEIESDRSPAFVKLAHVRGKGDVESNKIATAWDNIATVDFYQRDWTDSGIPFVRAGETYWSGWWFATIAERDRFLEWRKARQG